MAAEPGEGKTICLYNFKYYVTLPVSSKLTAEEVQNDNVRRSGPLPKVRLLVLGPTDEIIPRASFVSVNSMTYCIACPPQPYGHGDEVKIFDPTATELRLDHSCPKMKQARHSPLVTAVDGIIYVFGGVYQYRKLRKDYIWAECLDTNQPKDKQQWVALAAPPLPQTTLVEPEYVVPFLDNSVLLFGPAISQDCLLYNVNTKSWNEHNFLPGQDSVAMMRPLYVESHPLYVESHNTMYWIVDYQLFAFDLVSKIDSAGDILNSVLHDIRNDGLQDTGFGRVLLHLEGDIFCVFTTYSTMEEGQVRQILECTKFQVTKSGHSLQIDVLGYQSYVCDVGGGFLKFYGGVPIARSIDASVEPPTGKHKQEFE